jgi:hypothetical protein
MEPLGIDIFMALVPFSGVIRPLLVSNYRTSGDGIISGWNQRENNGMQRGGSKFWQLQSEKPSLARSLRSLETQRTQRKAGQAFLPGRDIGEGLLRLTGGLEVRWVDEDGGANDAGWK